MSSFRNPNKVSKNSVFSRCDQYRHNYFLEVEQFVTITFLHFWLKFFSPATLVMSVNENVAKVATKFYCETCDYHTSKQYNFDKHILTAKHKKMAFGDQGDSLGDDKSSNLSKYKCNICSKQYYSPNGIWLHKKKCKLTVNTNSEPTVNKTPLDKDGSETIPDLKSSENLIHYLLKENSEFKSLIMELVKKDFISNSHNTNNNTINNVNSHNKSFCLNVFLNDTCKGAMNMSEFVDTIKIQMSDLENFAHMDYPDGVSKILLKNLNNLDINLRPIHCSDLKRETVYIKENDEWTKETDDMPNLKNAIKQIAFKNIKHINEWVKEHPGCRDPTTKQNVKYNKIVMNSMSGTTKEEQQENIEKIVKNVTKAVTIDKSIV